MTTAIIGVGNIGGALARHLVRGGEHVVLAAQEEPNAAALAAELGPRASAATVPEAIGAADAVVFAVWPDALKQLLTEYAGRPARTTSRRSARSAPTSSPAARTGPRRRAVLFYGRSGSKSTRLIQAMTTHPALADHEPGGRTLLMVVPPHTVTGHNGPG